MNKILELHFLQEIHNKLLTNVFCIWTSDSIPVNQSSTDLELSLIEHTLILKKNSIKSLFINTFYNKWKRLLLSNWIEAIVLSQFTVFKERDSDKTNFFSIFLKFQEKILLNIFPTSNVIKEKEINSKERQKKEQKKHSPAKFFENNGHIHYHER